MSDHRPRKKPCPFCKGDSLNVEFYAGAYGQPNFYAVVCANVDCRAVGPLDLGESGAIERWNRRPIEEGLVSGIAIAQEVSREFCQETERVKETVRKVASIIKAQQDNPVSVGISITEAGVLEEAERMLLGE